MRKLYDLVRFNIGPIQGEGIVKGIATTEQAVLGWGYIIEVTKSSPAIPSTVYPYTHIVVQDAHILD